jgi:hypothetical protein
MLQLARNGIATRRNRTYRSAALFPAHDEKQAQRLLDDGLAAAARIVMSCRTVFGMAIGLPP